MKFEIYCSISGSLLWGGEPTWHNTESLLRKVTALYCPHCVEPRNTEAAGQHAKDGTKTIHCVAPVYEFGLWCHIDVQNAMGIWCNNVWCTLHAYRIGKCGIYSWTCNKSRDIGAWRLRSQQNIRGQVVTPLPSEVCHLAGGVTDGQGRWTASAAPIVHKLNLVILYGPLLKLLWNEYMWMLDILCLWDGRISTAPSHRTCSDATLPNPS